MIRNVIIIKSVDVRLVNINFLRQILVVLCDLIDCRLQCHSERIIFYFVFSRGKMFLGPFSLIFYIKVEFVWKSCSSYCFNLFCRVSCNSFNLRIYSSDGDDEVALLRFTFGFFSCPVRFLGFRIICSNSLIPQVVFFPV